MDITSWAKLQTLLTLGVVKWIANFHHCWLMLQKNCISRMRKTNNSSAPPLLMLFFFFILLNANCYMHSSSAMQIKTLRWCYGRDYMQITLMLSDELASSVLHIDYFQWFFSETSSFRRLSGSCVVCAFHFPNQRSNFNFLFLSAVDVWIFTMNCKFANKHSTTMEWLIPWIKLFLTSMAGQRQHSVWVREANDAPRQLYVGFRCCRM